MNKKPLGLYIHIPFCGSKCRYCDFYSEAGQSRAKKEEYIAAACKCLGYYGAQAREFEVGSVYIGGGTPSCVDAALIKKLLNAVYGSFHVGKACEISAEVNPASGSGKYLKKIRSAGVNRLSIGMQSEDAGMLALLGRPHSPADFEAAYAAARDAGFSNISVDVMYGLPGQTVESFQNTLEYLIKLGPEHISAYGLKLEEGTELHRNKDQYVFPDEDAEFEMYSAAAARLGGTGYRQYEISNFSKKGRECRHNMKYWRCEEYIGIGPAAHSYFCGKRFSYVRDTAAFIAAMNGGEAGAIDEYAEISQKERVGEYIMLSLRLNEGISEADFAARFGREFREPYGKRLEPFIRADCAVQKNGTYSLTVKGMFLSNYIIGKVLGYSQ